MRKIVSILLGFSIFLLLFSMVDFKNPIVGVEEIENTFFVLTVGIDKGIENKDNVRISVLEEKFTKTDSGSSQKPTKEATIRTAEGKTTFDAVRNLGLTTSRKIFFGQIKQLVICEDLAKENIASVIDFMVKDHETRFDIEILVASGTSAEGILKSGEKIKEFVPDALNGLLGSIGKQSFSKKVNMLELMINLDDRDFDMYLPIIKLIELDDKEGKVESSFELNGFAVFNDNKMIGTITDKLARGLNWIKDDIISGIVVVKDNTNSNGNVSLEIIDSNSNIEIKMNGNLPEVIINIEVTSNIAEQMSQQKINTEEGIENLEKEQLEEVKKEAESIIKYAQYNKVDILGIGNSIYHKYPFIWEDIKGNWKEMFCKMNIKVNVESRVIKSYHVGESMGTEEGEKE